MEISWTPGSSEFYVIVCAVNPLSIDSKAGRGALAALFHALRPLSLSVRFFALFPGLIYDVAPPPLRADS